MPSVSAIWNNSVIPAVAITVGCLTIAGCGGSSGSRSGGLPGHEVLGAGTSTVLIVDRVSATGQAKIGQATARQAVEQPFAAPTLDGPVQQFGLGRVTVTGGLGAEGRYLPRYDKRLAWVGIYEVSTNGPHSCPGQPAAPAHQHGSAAATQKQQQPSASLPPVFHHYYFAVLVDAATGQQATWNEDVSGLLIRQCAGASAP